jgi:hypothetical protein
MFRPTYYFEQEDGKEEVTALCKRYLDFLDKVLNDFCANNQPGCQAPTTPKTPRPFFRAAVKTK